MQVHSFNFNGGERVEIIKTTKHTTSYHPATILQREPHLPPSKKPRKTTTSDDEDEDEDEEEDVYLVQEKDTVKFISGDEIRPVPVPSRDEEAVVELSVDDKVDVLREDGCWVKGTIVGVLYEGTKYMVNLGDHNDLPLELSRDYLRLHRDWIYGLWLPPFHQEESFKMDLESISRPETISEVKSDSSGRRVTLRFKGTKTLSKTKYTPRTPVEVRSDEDGYRGSWYVATVVRSAGIGKFLIEYETLTTEDEMTLLREVAKEQDIRPRPPLIPQINRYNVLDEVDAWYNDGWWEGSIYEVLDDGKYIVYFATSNEKLVFEHSNLRCHQNWVDGKWVTALQKKDQIEGKTRVAAVVATTHDKVSKTEILTPDRSSDLKLRRSSSEMPHNQFQANQTLGKGTVVEVRSDEQGYEGSWYTAIIVKSIRKGKFLVEYLTLKTEDEQNSLREEVDAQNIRPCPPKEIKDSYLELEKVDAWYNDGWWAGEVSKVLGDNKYKVYFNTSKEELEFHHVNLRTRRELINGKWIIVL